MFNLPDYFYDLNLFSIAIRLLFAFLVGGAIGLERGANLHPAGFRTHILVCVGAALAMLTNQYISEIWTNTDPARLGAQVITGVGFLGVGTILLTSKNKIKGLTTAAGLWASACLGLAIGIGFYEAAVIGAILIFLSLAILPKLENYIYEHSGLLNIAVEVENLESFKRFMGHIESLHMKIYESHFHEESHLTKDGVSFTLSLRPAKYEKYEKIIKDFKEIEGVLMVEEI